MKAESKKKRLKMRHEKELYKLMIDADVSVTEIASLRGVSHSAVTQRILKGDAIYIKEAIKELNGRVYKKAI